MEQNRSLSSIAFFLLLVSSAFSLQPFQSKKSPSETIHEYEIVDPVLMYGDETSPEGHPKEITVSVNSENGTTHQLKLLLNEMLLAPSFAAGQHTNEGLSDETHHDNCFYHGTVEGHEDWSAVFSTCYGLRGWFGSLHDSSNLYHIEPMEDTSSLTGPHALYMDSQHQNNKQQGTCGTSGKQHEIEDLLGVNNSPESSQHQIRKREAGTPQNRIMEWLLINDYYQYMNYDSNVTAVTHRALEIANHVDMLYDQLNISIVLVYSLTWTEGQNVTFSNDANTLLNRFKEYHRTNADLKKIVHDSTMFITGIDIEGVVVGLAAVNEMCDYDDGVGLVQDTRKSLIVDALTAAHELGHIFNMQHDDAASCNCSDAVQGCIMYEFIKFPTMFSECSLNELAVAYSQGKDSCLFNHPTMLVGDPVCGNGIREPGEVCDCGSVEECQDPCCNAATCTLKDGNDCGEGECCENCKFKPQGTLCREAEAVCGIAEYCNGTSTDCPRNVYQQDGTPCNGGADFCFDGECPNLSTQCELYYGSGTSPGNQLCYDYFNTMGTTIGHCGVTNSSFVGCASDDVNCGSIQCTNGGGPLTPVFANIMASSAITYFSTHYPVPPFYVCSTFTTAANVDEVSPGLVADGTKCGDNKLCLSQKCIDVSSLHETPCPVGSNGEVCSGNGVCNNLDECSCNIGYGGADCSDNNTETTTTPTTTITTPTTSTTTTTITYDSTTTSNVVTSTVQSSPTSTTPTDGTQSSNTPTDDVQSATPTDDTQSSATPTDSAAATSTDVMQSSTTPTNVMKSSTTPTNVMQSSTTPNEIQSSTRVLSSSEREITSERRRPVPTSNTRRERPTNPPSNTNDGKISQSESPSSVMNSIPADTGRTDSGASSGAVAGGVIGAVIFMIILVLLIIIVIAAIILLTRANKKTKIFQDYGDGDVALETKDPNITIVKMTTPESDPSLESNGNNGTEKKSAMENEYEL